MDLVLEALFCMIIFLILVFLLTIILPAIVTEIAKKSLKDEVEDVEGKKTKSI